MTATIPCRRRTECRLCDGTTLTELFKLTPTPPANAFVKSAEPQQTFPLDLFYCNCCGHVQLLDVVDPSVLFENYVYVSGTSPVFVKHFQDYADAAIKEFGLPPGSFVVDIGSNDGTFLQFFQDEGLRVLGIDPAVKIAEAANERGIETMVGFFTPLLAEQIRASRGPAAAVFANNVFAHVDDLAGLTRGVAELLAPDGLFCFEVSYLADVVEKTLFDTIYHEHLAYHAVTPLVRFLDRCGLELIGASRVPSHGGSLRGVAQLKGGPRAIGPSVSEFLELEQRLGLLRPDTFRRFFKNVEARKIELRALLGKLKDRGCRIAGFGAPAKATTLMHHFALGPETFDFIVDDSPWKQGLLTPGLHVPVLPPSAIAEKRPDYLLVLAWNFAESIIAKNEAFRAAGGKFIVPLPKVKVVE